LTFVASSQGSKSFRYTSLPYAVTVNEAVTFCTSVLVPPTLKVTAAAERSYWMSSVLTVIEGLFIQAVNPFVLRTSDPSTAAGRAATRRVLMILRWWECRDRIVNHLDPGIGHRREIGDLVRCAVKVSMISLIVERRQYKDVRES